MKIAIKQMAPWFAAAAIGGAIVLAPVASAATAPQNGTGPDPLVTYGTNPYVPVYPSPGDPTSPDQNQIANSPAVIDQAF
jgi:hypothetical protein